MAAKRTDYRPLVRKRWVFLVGRRRRHKKGGFFPSSSGWPRLKSLATCNTNNTFKSESSHTSLMTRNFNPQAHNNCWIVRAEMHWNNKSGQKNQEHEVCKGVAALSISNGICSKKNEKKYTLHYTQDLVRRCKKKTTTAARESARSAPDSPFR